MKEQTLGTFKLILQSPEVTHTEPEEPQGSIGIHYHYLEEEVGVNGDKLEECLRDIHKLKADSKEHTKRFAECTFDLELVREHINGINDDKVAYKELIKTKEAMDEMQEVLNRRIIKLRNEIENNKYFLQNNSKRVEASIEIGTENDKRLTSSEAAQAGLEERLASYQKHNEKRVDAALLIGTENGKRLTSLETAHNGLVKKVKTMEASFSSYVASTARTIVILNERIELLEGGTGE